MEISLAGKTALVTGASKGIGKAIARQFAESGADVMLSSRKQDQLEAAAAEIADAGATGQTAVFAANAGSLEAAEACVTATIEHFGRLDVLVNNAATNPYYGATLGIEPSQYDKTLEVHRSGETHAFDSFECAIHALAPVCEHCGCRVIGHGVETEGRIFCCVHCAAEAGVAGLADRA